MFCESNLLCVLKKTDIVKEIEGRVDTFYQDLSVELTVQLQRKHITYKQCIDCSGFTNCYLNELAIRLSNLISNKYKKF